MQGYLFVAADNNDIYIYDLELENIMIRKLVMHENSVTIFNQINHMLEYFTFMISFSLDRRIQFWDISEFKSAYTQ